MPSHAALSSETRFAFRAADPSVTPEELIALAKVMRDWPRALTLAEMEGATPALWRALQPHRAELPKEIAEFLRMRTMVSEFRMTLLSQRAQDSVRAIAAAGIPVMLLKGAAIGALTDPTFRTRPMGDVDLLVHPEHAARASELLLETGWSVTSDEVVVELLQGQHHLPHFVRSDLPGLRLELHTMLLPPGHSFALELDELWRLAIPAPAPFDGAVLLSPEHHVLHASIHFAWQHRVHFGAWRTVRSIAAMTQRPDFSWERLEALARSTKAGTTVYWTLRMSQLLSAIPVPGEVLKRLAPPNPAWLMRALERHFVAAIAQGEGVHSPSVWTNRRLWLAALRPEWSGLGKVPAHDRGRDWDRAYGRESREGAIARVTRHAGNYRHWMAFFSRTILGR
jgi:hypothetical protein